MSKIHDRSAKAMRGPRWAGATLGPDGFGFRGAR